MPEIIYEGDVYRPPSEARSLILQATIGCSHNRCTFCTMYKRKKFRERKFEEIQGDIKIASRLAPNARRVFLADGNALTIETSRLVEILKELQNMFPALERVGVYCNPHDLLAKDVGELEELKRHRLGMLYLGVESGSASVLEDIKKGVGPAEMAAGAKKAKASGIPLSVTVINGLAGREGTVAHAAQTARLLNEIDPDYLGLLTLGIVPGTRMARRVAGGELTPLSPWEIMEEIRLMVKDLDLSGCTFRANHASNYLPIGAFLSRDQEQLMSALDRVLSERPSGILRPEWQRGF